MREEEGDVRWGDVRWGDVRWGEVRWGEVRWGEVRWGEVRWGEVRWGEVRCGEVSKTSSWSWVRLPLCASFFFIVEDIGIITPYRKQVQKINELAHNLKSPYNGCKVGTVENFQGQVSPPLSFPSPPSHSSPFLFIRNERSSFFR